MHLTRKHVIFGTAAVLAAVGGSAALAASQAGSPSEDSEAIIDDTAAQLGVSPSKLSEALKKALGDRVDEAVAAGRLSKDEGEALKARIQSDDFPLFGGLDRGFGHFGHFGDLDAAAGYLGLTEAQLRSELENGKSLARVARDHDKSVDGLIEALVAAAKQKLDGAVAAGRITPAQESAILAGLRDRITNLVNSTGLGGPPPGFRRFGGPFA
jgi:uncharacterized protein YidB (DUF937 family)